MKEAYKKQVDLLLRILPEVAEEKNFALHGGTGINLFELNLPRLSVDIDLTYTTFGERTKDLQTIRMLLEDLKKRIQNRIPTIVFSDPIVAAENLKILCTTKEASVKIEVNQINRGLIGASRIMTLCEKAQEEFDSFCEMSVVSSKQLWGGKIAAALDRQHPRDLFDVNNLLNGTGFMEDIKSGFLFFLLCGKRPINEMLNPQLINQDAVFSSQFNGMTDQPFSYKEYQTVRSLLLETIHRNLTSDEKEFLLAFVKGEPIWDKIDYSMYPSISWKLMNIDILKKNNPKKFQEQITLLEQVLY
jgi:predicted nucleotidyltransferase component of viral defense system